MPYLYPLYDELVVLLLGNDETIQLVDRVGRETATFDREFQFLQWKMRSFIQESTFIRVYTLETLSNLWPFLRPNLWPSQAFNAWSLKNLFGGTGWSFRETHSLLEGNGEFAEIWHTRETLYAKFMTNLWPISFFCQIYDHLWPFQEWTPDLQANLDLRPLYTPCN